MRNIRNGEKKRIKTPIDSDKNESRKKMKHPDKYEEFIRWMATPEPIRDIKTQGEFAKQIGASEDTLSDWRKRKGFWEEVREQRKKWGREKTPNVIVGLYRKAVRDGNATEVKLWLQYFEGWQEGGGVDLQSKELKEISKDIKKIAENL